jgi:hypothetical protein
MTQWTHAIQARLGLRRRKTVTVPIPVEQARHHLKMALAKPITLTGRFQVTRHYWGQISPDRLTLNGPRAVKQFCFLTRGELHGRGNQTELVLQVYLRDQDFYQLAMAAGILLILLPLVLRWWGLTVLPLFLGFLYGMTQWHLSHYAQEITQLLAELMTGNEVTGKADSDR